MAETVLVSHKQGIRLLGLMVDLVQTAPKNRHQQSVHKHTSSSRSTSGLAHRTDCPHTRLMAALAT